MWLTSPAPDDLHQVLPGEGGCEEELDRSCRCVNSVRCRVCKGTRTVHEATSGAGIDGPGGSGPVNRQGERRGGREVARPAGSLAKKTAALARVQPWRLRH